MSSLPTEEQQDRFQAYKLYQKGKKIERIALKFNKSIRWVQRNNKRFEETGSFEDRPRTGRPHVLKARDIQRLVNKVKGKRRQSVRKTSRAFKSSTGKKISRETIRKTIKSAGLYPHRRRKVTFLTEKQKERRVRRFAKAYRHFDWNTCSFWDETEFELHCTPNIKNDITWE